MKQGIRILILKLIISCLLPLWVMTSLAAEAKFEEGKHYTLIPAQKNGVPLEHNQFGRVAVVEFFSYGCPWCYRLEPTIESWLNKRKNTIQFQRVPVIFHDEWMLYARAYYLLKAFGLESKYNHALFDAIQSESAPLRDEKHLEQFFGDRGIKAAEFESAFQASPVIDAELAQGQNLAKRYEIDRVPTFVIGGKYRTDIGMVEGDSARLTALLDFLIKKANYYKTK